MVYMICIPRNKFHNNQDLTEHFKGRDNSCPKKHFSLGLDIICLGIKAVYMRTHEKDWRSKFTDDCYRKASDPKNVL